LNEAPESRKFPLRPIGVGMILLTVAVGLIAADLGEYFFLRIHEPPAPFSLISHWASEIFVLFLVFSLLYRPFKLRSEQRQGLIRALQTSEDQYRTLVESLDVGIALIDDQRTMIMCNKAMNKFMIDPDCDVSQRKCYQLLIHPDGELCTSCPGAKTLASGRPAVLEIVLPEAADSPVNAVRVSTFPVSSVEGRVDQFIEVVEDISEGKKTAAEIQRLSRELASAAESERKRLARDLHDQCGQVLAGVQYTLEALRADIVVELPEMSDHFDTISNMVEQIGHNIRQVSTQLHPSVLDDFGLVPTLKWLADEFQRQRPNIEVAVSSEPISDSLASDIGATIYRICQESLNNISKHAKASRITIHFGREEDQAVLKVTDDGCGFLVEEMMSRTAPSGHIGLHGMAERAQALGGRLVVRSAPGSGTSVEARIPYLLEN